MADVLKGSGADLLADTVVGYAMVSGMGVCFVCQGHGFTYVRLRYPDGREEVTCYCDEHDPLKDRGKQRAH